MTTALSKYVALRTEFDANPANRGYDFHAWVRNQVGFSTEETDEVLTSLRSVVLPFAGFYETLHDSEYDCSLERMFDREGSSPEYASKLQARFFDTIDWHAAQIEYAKAYADNFKSAIGLTLCEFEEMNSPREYNFTTDRIFVKFALCELQALFARADIREELDSVSADMFTSRSGFMSYYSPDVESWGDLDEWDANHFGALVKAAANVIIADGREFDQSQEFDLMESSVCNGEIEEWIWGNTTDNAVMGNRCDKIAEYLVKREAR